MRSLWESSKLISSPDSWKNYIPWKPVLGSKKVGDHWCIEHHSRVCQENRVGYRAQLESLPAKWLTEIPETLAFLHRCAVLILSLSPASLICPHAALCGPAHQTTCTNPPTGTGSFLWGQIHLILFRLLSHNGTDRVAHQQHGLISPSCDGWEVQDQGANTFAVSWDPLPGL